MNEERLKELKIALLSNTQQVTSDNRIWYTQWKDEAKTDELIKNFKNEEFKEYIKSILEK